MDDFAAYNSKVYTDIQGLKQLQYNYKENASAVKKEVAQQFESILMQMVLSSMRNANKAFASDMFGSNQMEFYQDMFDKQLALSLSSSGVGFANMVEKNIDQMEAGALSEAIEPVSLAPNQSDGNASISTITPMPTNSKPKPIQEEENSYFNTPEEFMKKLWGPAKLAASLIGATPEILLAQAAHETNWGKNIIPHGKQGSTYNLFNIKAGNNWNNSTTTIDSLEQKNGVLVKEKSNFRSYRSYMDSFLDYANFLRQNSRYSDSLAKAAHPGQFIHALQSAGYATDQGYADKVMKIFSSHGFQDLVAKLKSKV